MKNDWDRLAEHVHPTVFIANVNCSDEEKLCEQSGIGGYPTIRIYRNGGLAVEDYQGARVFDDLWEFVDRNLALKCKVTESLTTCSEKSLNYLTKLQARDEAAIVKEVTRLSTMLTSKSVSLELRGWVGERLLILQQLVPDADS
jgi:thioredoxin-like negative regulator of GroEL